MTDSDVTRIARARLGKVLRGKYRLDHVLGIGGMAVVYAATHRNKKRFAIKMLHPELSIRDNVRTRFLREGYVANSVEHPGAVAVLDDDVAEDGSAFIVMELLEGAPVDEVWARGGKKLPVGLVLSIGDSLLDVLVAAHGKRIIHRDLKPANLFLTHDGRLEVLDFGIARLHDATSTDATATGAMLGTPAFMAPEQAMGESSKVDAQTDLWAVGATLFFLLSGQFVHSGDNPSQLLISAATKKARPLASAAPDVPAAVAGVIDRALAFDRDARWASAAEMREALRGACVEATGAPIAPLPKGDGASTRGGSRASGESSGPASGNVEFDPTVDASSGAIAGADVTPEQTTGAAVSKSRPGEVEARARRPSWKLVGSAVVVIGAAVAGVVRYRAAHAPRVHYCMDIDDTIDGPRCIFEVGADILGKRSANTYRVTERGGRTDLIESVNFAGRVSDPDENDVGKNGYARAEVHRDEAGAVQEIIRYDSSGMNVRWEKWSEGGRRVDFVDVDGKSPRHLVDSSATTVRLEWGSTGHATREMFFGPSGHPRLGSSGAFGQAYEHGATPGHLAKLTFLGVDGRPMPDAEGVAFKRYADDGSPWGDASKFDLDGRPIAPKGAHTWHDLHDGYDKTGFRSLGLQGEPVTSLYQGFHEARRAWDPAKHTRTWTIYDERGHLQAVQGVWFFVLRETFDERGRKVLEEQLDGQGNRMLVRNGVSAAHFAFDDRDRCVLIENMDPAGVPMQGLYGYARREATVDDHGNPLEYRHFDEAGRLTPWKEGGAIQRATFDDRDLWTSVSNFDAAARAVTNSHGVWSSRSKFDRLRNEVEVTYVGTDGKPTVSDEGFATRRTTYDDDDDLVAESYFDESGAPTPFDGSFATHRLEYDDRGLAIAESYFDAHGDPVLIKDGYASLRMARDRNGDVIEESFLGKHGEPTLREGGFAQRKTRYDVMRRRVEVTLFDADGKPRVGTAGWAIEKTTYDERGLVVRVDHLDASGAAVRDRDGRASVTKKYDSRGNVIEETSLDVDGKPVASPDGYATKRTAFDDRDEVTEEALLGPDGKPATGKDGWSLRRLRYDDFGDQTEEAFFEAAHEPVVPKDLSYASMRQRYDARHRLVEVDYLDVRGAPTKGPDGAPVVRYKPDGYGRPIETSYLDGTGAPSASKDGRIVVHSTYDDGGHLVDERFVDGAGAPHAAADACAGHHIKYDPRGRKLEEACLDASGAPLLSGDGWALRRTLHDARGNDVEIATYGPDATLHADKDGIARRRNRFDERNLLLETTLFDVNDKPAHDRKGVHATRYAYDDRGKKTGETAFDERGRPVRIATSATTSR